MLYEKKRTFGLAPIDLADAAFTVAASVYAGDLAVSATPATAGMLDYEAVNQHFPDENTLEVYGWETADSAADGATLAVTLQSSANGTDWKDEQVLSFLQAAIKEGALIYRGTIPGLAGRYLRIKLVVGTEVFTAGKILALVRPL